MSENIHDDFKALEFYVIKVLKIGKSVALYGLYIIYSRTESLTKPVHFQG